MAIEIKVPSVGESISEVEIGQWLKNEGESVAQDEALVMLDSAKTTVELPAPAAGVLAKILKQPGEVAAVGEVIGSIESGGEPAPESTPAPDETKAEGEPAPEWEKPATAAEKKDAAQEQAVAPQTSGAKPETKNSKPETPFVMPAAERVLRERGLDAAQVEGSGPGGRILKEDVLSAKTRETQDEQRKAKEPEATPQKAGVPVPGTPVPSAPVPAMPAPSPQPPTSSDDEEVVPMSLLRRQIASRLVEAQQTAALLTTFNEIDMSAVIAMRKELQESFQKKYSIKLGFMSFFVKAAVDALKQVPQINAEIRDKNIVFKNHYDIGVAIGSGKGLVVPVIRRAERLSFAEVETAIADFASRIKENKLMPDELAGGTFTITNGGVFGSLLSTPIVNPPQSAILGMHATQERPVARNGEVVIRPMMYVALTYDHRVVDGREAVQFLVRIKECIENPTRMLVEV
jgi:2-oxoglutarate dehydrogenase E2 component (dihydrolipoamide succinyltransferase)